MAYIVKSKRKSGIDKGKIIYSKVYKTKEEANKHVSNTKKNWSTMYSNPRIKKI